MAESASARALHPPVEAVGRALGDPLRIALLQRLLDGPATVSDLVAGSSHTQSNVSNHLAILRSTGLVSARRQGRRALYALASPSVAHLVEALGEVTGRRTRPKASPALAAARTCYDHLAGRLGVGLLDALLAAGALVAVTSPSPAPARAGRADDYLPGPNAGRVFGSLGVDLASASRTRRSRAIACVDWTEARPHLGGAIGCAILRAFLDAGLVRRESGTRAVRITPAGRRRLAGRLPMPAGSLG